MPDKDRVFMGVDVGGTKILAALVKPSGQVVARKRVSTPTKGKPEDVLETILGVMADLMAEEGTKHGVLESAGLAVPGVVDTAKGRVVVTPNMNLSGVRVVPAAQKRLGVPVALGNDVNLGTLGERWLGAAAGAHDIVGIFPGTGIGGGIILDGRLVEGVRGAAAEVGHMIMEIDGPPCGCGGRGCLEALASRTAIERDIRAAIKAKRPSIVEELADGDLSRIRSGVLKKALLQQDRVVTEVVTRAARVLGMACLSLRHLLDPEVIVLGGGVMEACGFFIMPIVEKIMKDDPLGAAGEPGRVVLSALGDDAVVLGAVALAQELAGHNPYKASDAAVPKYPIVDAYEFGRITLGGKTYSTDVYVRASGKVKKRRKADIKELYGTTHKVGPEEVQKLVKGRPGVLVVGTGAEGKVEVAADARKILSKHGVTLQALPTPDAVAAFNALNGRKAAVFHVTC
jgi:glucokinase